MHEISIKQLLFIKSIPPKSLNLIAIAIIEKILFYVGYVLHGSFLMQNDFRNPLQFFDRYFFENRFGNRFCIRPKDTLIIIFIYFNCKTNRLFVYGC